jgi:hypothetical protein
VVANALAESLSRGDTWLEGRGHLNSQSLRIRAARNFLMASFCLVLSLLTRSASKSGEAGAGRGCEFWRNRDRGDLVDLYRSANNILGDEAEDSLLAPADLGEELSRVAAAGGSVNIAWPAAAPAAPSPVECGAAVAWVASWCAVVGRRAGEGGGMMAGICRSVARV